MSAVKELNDTGQIKFVVLWQNIAKICCEEQDCKG